MYLNYAKNISTDVEQIGNILAHALKLSVYFIDNQETLFFHRRFNHEKFPLERDKHDLTHQLIEQANQTGNDRYPFHFMTSFAEHQLSIPLYFKEIYIGRFFLGPFLTQPMLDKDIIPILQKNHVSLRQEGEFRRYYRSLPIMKEETIAPVSQLLYLLLYQDILDVNAFSSPQEPEEKGFNPYDSDWTEPHHSYLWEQNLMQCVRQGNLEKLKQILSSPFDGQIGVLSHQSTVQDRQFRNVATIAVVTRQAIEAGMPPHTAYQYSDQMIQKVGKLDNIDQLQAYFQEILYFFTMKIQQLHRQNLGYFTYFCQQHIRNHLYDPQRSIQQIADQMQKSPNYISVKFKEETGQTLVSFMAQEKIEESKTLLQLGYSITQTASLLHFNDQSYFSKTFKKIAGETPLQFIKSKK